MFLSRSLILDGFFSLWTKESNNNKIKYWGERSNLIILAIKKGGCLCMPMARDQKEWGLKNLITGRSSNDKGNEKLVWLAQKKHKIKCNNMGFFFHEITQFNDTVVHKCDILIILCFRIIKYYLNYNFMFFNLNLNFIWCCISEIQHFKLSQFT